MRSWWRVVSLALLSCACGSNEPSSPSDGAGAGGTAGGGGSAGSAGSAGLGGSAGASGASGGASRAHPMCSPTLPPPSYPEDVGDGCGAGSNLALCLAGTDDTACTSGMCLWHSNDPAGEQAYCTAACSPADAASCPAGFACQTESCDQTSVCVRTSPSTTPVLKIEAHATTLSNNIKTALGIDGSGAPYWGSSDGSIYRWDGTTMNLIGTTVFARAFDAVSSNGAIYLDPNGDEEQLGVIQNGALTTASLPVNTSARGFLATQSGSAYYLQSRGSASTYRFVPLDPTLMPLVDETSILPAAELVPRPGLVHALRSYGFFGECIRPNMTVVECFSTDGRTVNEAPGANARYSLDPTSLWGVLTDAGTAAKWDGQAWVAETELFARNPNVVAVFPLRGATPDRVLAFASSSAGSEVYYLNGTCWQPLHDDPNVDIGFSEDYAPYTLLQLDEMRVAWFERSIVLNVVRLDSFANF